MFKVSLLSSLLKLGQKTIGKKKVVRFNLNYPEVKGVKDDRWHLLTGDREAIYTLTRKSYFVDKELGVDKTADEFLHTENFVLVDKNLRIREVYNGTLKLEVRRCMEDMKLLLLE